MKKFYIRALSLVIGIISLYSVKSYSQVYEIINGLQTTIGPAISGAGNYKGYVEAGYSHTLGHYNGDFIGVLTSQGYKYKSWFYVGAGLGVDVLLAHPKNDRNSGMTPPSGFVNGQKSTTTAVMLPLFTDFRFDIGNSTEAQKASFYLDLKIGCSFLLSDRYIAIGDGYLTNREYFFLKPSIGVRIPVSMKHPRQAIDMGITYQLLTSNYWVNYNNNITLQALGANVAFEW